jgi:hypothetical protein
MYVAVVVTATGPMSSATDDDALRNRLRAKLEQKAEGDTDDPSTDTEAYGEDDEMDDEDDEMDMNAEAGETVNEAAQMIAEAMDDVTPDQVMEMLSPLMGEDTRDDDAEMAADTDGTDGDVVTEEQLAEKLDNVVTEDDLESKLDTVVDALADETRDVLQKADVGGTPTPTATGGSSVTKSQLFSDTTEDN